MKFHNSQQQFQYITEETNTRLTNVKSLNNYRTQIYSHNGMQYNICFI